MSMCANVGCMNEHVLLHHSLSETINTSLRSDDTVRSGSKYIRVVRAAEASVSGTRAIEVSV